MIEDVCGWSFSRVETKAFFLEFHNSAKKVYLEWSTLGRKKMLRLSRRVIFPSPHKPASQKHCWCSKSDSPILSSLSPAALSALWSSSLALKTHNFLVSAIWQGLLSTILALTLQPLDIGKMRYVERTQWYELAQAGTVYMHTFDFWCLLWRTSGKKKSPKDKNTARVQHSVERRGGLHAAILYYTLGNKVKAAALLVSPLLPRIHVL